jgi:cyclic pyranopterin phosphate synthase
MVDVGDKSVTKRLARAEAFVRMSDETRDLLMGGGLEKGDAPAAARIAGIMAAKRTPDIIPLCHPIELTAVSVGIESVDGGVRLESVAETAGRTGVEMEAMTAVAVAALTIYDMVKGRERGVVVERVRLLEKSGGASGEWRRE